MFRLDIETLVFVGNWIFDACRIKIKSYKTKNRKQSKFRFFDASISGVGNIWLLSSLLISYSFCIREEKWFEQVPRPIWDFRDYFLHLQSDWAEIRNLTWIWGLWDKFEVLPSKVHLQQVPGPIRDFRNYFLHLQFDWAEIWNLTWIRGLWDKFEVLPSKGHLQQVPGPIRDFKDLHITDKSKWRLGSTEKEKWQMNERKIRRNKGERKSEGLGKLIKTHKFCMKTILLTENCALIDHSKMETFIIFFYCLFIL